MRKLIRALTGGAMLVGGAAVANRNSSINAMIGRFISDTGRHLRYLAGRLEGFSYAIEGRHPDPDVVDTVLADRIRSELGGLEKRRDLPHVHVMVEDHVALLHGDVATQADADAIEKAVNSISGVKGVKSHLHVGLLDGDTRPSQGRARSQA